MNEIKEPVEAAPNKNKEEICADFLSVAGTVIVAGVYTAASQFINSLIFLITDSPDLHHMQAIQKNIAHTERTFKTNEQFGFSFQIDHVDCTNSDTSWNTLQETEVK